MTDKITGYLIDAKAGTIRPVTLDGKNRLKSIYAHLDCACIDIVDLSGDHIVYCDDNGLTDGLHCFTELAGFPDPLAGNLLVTGVDGDGDSVSPLLPIEAVAGLFMIYRIVFDPAFEQIDAPDVVGISIKGFRTRIQWNIPKIVTSEVSF